MTQTTLPTLNELVTITNGVSETLFGISLRHDRAGAALTADASWRAEALTLTGERPLKVVMAMQGEALKNLAQAVLEEDPANQDTLLDNVLGEMVNLVAGQIKAVLSRDYTMGLPHTEPVTLDQRGDNILSAWLVSLDAKVKVWTAVIESD